MVVDVVMSVGKGRPDRLTSPPGGSERSERGGMFHFSEGFLRRGAFGTCESRAGEKLLGLDSYRRRLVELRQPGQFLPGTGLVSGRKQRLRQMQTNVALCRCKA